MAGRIRSIKPEVLTDAKAIRLSDTAWRCWVSCWLLADDTGRLPGDAAVVGGQVFPLKPAKAADALAELVSAGLLVAYVVRGDPYFLISGFSKHQKVNRPSGPKFPAPSESDGGLTEGSVRAHGGLSEGSVLITTTTTTTNSAAKGRKRHLPSDWSPDPRAAQIAAEHGKACDRESERFKSYCLANGKTYVDFDQAFHGWLRRDFGGSAAVARPKGRDPTAAALDAANAENS